METNKSLNQALLSAAMMTTTGTAWLFPGQGGSQNLGLEQSLLTRYKARFQQAEEILGWSVVDVCNQKTKLDQTEYYQPCSFVIFSIVVDHCKQELGLPDFVAGYSFGEYIALYAAEVFDFESGLRLIKRRAQLMSIAPSGGMAILVGCNHENLKKQLCKYHNVEIISDEQVRPVISGLQTHMGLILSEIEVKRAFRLNVNKPFHTRFMQPIEEAYQAELDKIPFKNAKIPVLSNVNPVPTVNSDLLKRKLRTHMTAKILWQQTIDLLSDKKIIEPSTSMLPKSKQIQCKPHVNNHAYLENVA